MNVESCLETNTIADWQTATFFTSNGTTLSTKAESS